MQECVLGVQLTAFVNIAPCSTGDQDLSCSLGQKHPVFVFGVLCPSAAGFQAAIVKWACEPLL